MKKVATITFHCSYNYGSVLQAYALQRFLINHGYETQIIDYRSEDFDRYRIIPRKMGKKEIIRFSHTLKNLPAYLRRRDAFQTFWKKHLLMTEHTYTQAQQLKSLNDEFDVFICGSDQIWNLDCTHGVNPAFFLEFVEDGKRIVSYGASMAKLSFEKNYSEKIKSDLARFDYISVREASTLPYLKSLTGRDVFAVVDPTLLIKPEQFVIKKPAILKEAGPYIFVYMLGYSPELIDYCNYLSDSTKLPVYFIMEQESRSKYKPSGRDAFGASPDEFLYFISHAKYVLSNSFHATVFSVAYKKHFCTFHRKGSEARTIDFLRSLGLDRRTYSFDFHMDDEIDFQEAERKLNKMKDDSAGFLLNSLRE